MGLKFVKKTGTVAKPAPKTVKGEKNGKTVKGGKKGKAEPKPTRQPVDYGKERKVDGFVYQTADTARGTRIRFEGLSLSSVLRYLGKAGLTPKDVGEVFGYTRGDETVKGKFDLKIPYNTLFSQVNSGRLEESGNHTQGGSKGEEKPHHGLAPSDDEFPTGKKVLRVLFGRGKAKAK